MTSKNLIRFPGFFHPQTKRICREKSFTNAHIATMKESLVHEDKPFFYRLGFYEDLSAVVYCIDVEKEGIETFEKEVLKDFPELKNTYIETSQSGKGYHYFFIDKSFDHAHKFEKRKDEKGVILWEVKTDAIAQGSLATDAEFYLDERWYLVSHLHVKETKPLAKKYLTFTGTIDQYIDEYRREASEFLVSHYDHKNDHERFHFLCSRLADCNAPDLIQDVINSYSQDKHKTEKVEDYMRKAQGNIGPVRSVIKDLDDEFDKRFKEKYGAIYRKNETASTATPSTDSDTNRAINALLKKHDIETYDRIPIRFCGKPILVCFQGHEFYTKELLKKETNVYFTKKNGELGEAYKQLELTGKNWIDSLKAINIFIKDPAFPQGKIIEGKLNVSKQFTLPAPKASNIPLTMEYLFAVLSNGQDKQFQVLTSWLKKLLFFSFDRKYRPKALFFKGDYGTGKSFFHEHFLNKVLGDTYYYKITPDELKDSGFNAHLAGKLLIASDEILDIVGPYGNDVFKRLTTETTKTYNQKFLPSFTAPNYALYLFTYNMAVPRFVEPDSKRHIFMSVSDSRKDDRDFFSALSKEMDSPEWLSAFLHVINQAEILDYLDENLSRFLDIEQEKSAFFENGVQGAVRQFIAYALQKTLIRKNKKTKQNEFIIGASELYTEFRHFFVTEIKSNGEPSNTSFGTHLLKDLPAMGAEKKDASSGNKYIFPADWQERLKSIQSWQIVLNSIEQEEEEDLEEVYA